MCDLELQIGLRLHGPVSVSLRRLYLEGFQSGNDRSDWSTKFVRKHAREMVFGPVGGLHNYLLLLKLFLNASAFGHTGGKRHRRNSQHGSPTLPTDHGPIFRFPDEWAEPMQRPPPRDRGQDENSRGSF